MVLTIDIGNSSVALGLFDGEQLIGVRHLPANAECDSPLFFQEASLLLGAHASNMSELRSVVLSSVHPRLSKDLCRPLVERGIPLVVFDHSAFERLPLIIPNYEVGCDLIANALAAYHLYKGDCIIVDFGTALTHTAIAGNGQLLGVNISPGIMTSLRYLSKAIPLLPEVPFAIPQHALGRDTITAIQNGVIKGGVAAARGIIEDIQREFDKPFKVIYTGGLSPQLSALIRHPGILDRHLALKGLNIYIQSILGPKSTD